MPVFRCDFKVVGDLVLPNSVDNFQFAARKEYSVIIQNGETNEDGHTEDLYISVIGPASSLENGQKELRDVLAECLDLLTFSTHSRFKIVFPIRLIEWEEGKKERNFLAFHTFDSSYPPDPEFVEEFIGSIVELERCDPPNYTKLALKYFRYGLLDLFPEDQHMRLWLALEIVAENLKDKDSVPIVCPSCQSALKCPECGTEPTRIPMAKQAIESIINKIIGKDGKDVAKRQFTVRNGLMHGRSVKSIESKLKIDMANLVNELAFIVWHAIMSTFTLREDTYLNFGHRDGDFTNKSLTLSVHGLIKHTEDTPHPSDDKFPNIKISLKTDFNKT